jgi:hypothetical protein
LDEKPCRSSRDIERLCLCRRVLLRTLSSAKERCMTNPTAPPSHHGPATHVPSTLHTRRLYLGAYANALSLHNRDKFYFIDLISISLRICPHGHLGYDDSDKIRTCSISSRGTSRLIALKFSHLSSQRRLQMVAAQQVNLKAKGNTSSN